MAGMQVDLKPTNMDDLSEVITVSEFHPTHCNTFIYGSSKGCVRMGDMRSAALCDQHSKSFQVLTKKFPDRVPKEL